VQLARNAAPEFVGLLHRFFVEILVFSQAGDVRTLGEFRRRWEAALFVKNGIDAAVLEIR